jgi:general nucleoside transport system permease protein
MALVFADRSRREVRDVRAQRRRGQLFMLPNLRVPVVATVLVLTGRCSRSPTVSSRPGSAPFGRDGRVVAGLFVLAFLTWAAADGQLSVIGLLRGTVARATPIALGAMCGVMCERAGVINIAIEGQFLAGAFTAALFASLASNPGSG